MNIKIKGLLILALISVCTFAQAHQFRMRIDKFVVGHP